MRRNKPISFDDLLKELQEKKGVNDETEQAELGRLFNDSFMAKHSSCKTMQEFLEKGNFQAWTREDLDLIPKELLNRLVARETQFEDWQAMLDTANAELNRV
ncbi:hypothetical protein [Paenibacillus soyae]|uniref:Uncharacterized protein n=1 Tax=Paenibacillus soyae TaxID=2969249 RepID=A0A9X2SCT9_9BACL|nr:hypothetical protein [Paenibacillus soyae]MCR2807128.1 hypothetical protein [Paenibacillus soyae]